MIRVQLFTLTLIPTLLLLVAVAGLSVWQSRTLTQAIASQVQARMLADRKDALQNYATLAQSAIAPYLREDTGDLSGSRTEVWQELAKQTLDAMTFGEDGYFYVYDYEGTNLVHPRLTDLVGQNLWDLQDPEGNFVIQELIKQAQQGQGYHSYIWNKPSNSLDTPKIGFAVGIPEWGWMLGTGLYLDDLEIEVQAISNTIGSTVGSASRWFLIVGVTVVVLAAALVFAFQLHQQSQASRALQRLNKRIIDIQELQAKRISQDLHDGVSQSLVLARFAIEAVENRSDQVDSKTKSLLGRAQDNLDQALDELRRVAKSLRPPALDQLGLCEALWVLINDFQGQAGFKIEARLHPFGMSLSDFSKTALFRVAQEALTNITKHANADQVSVDLYQDKRRAYLVIKDNGVGIPAQVSKGFGLQNMSERLQSLGGMLTLTSRSDSGTTVVGWVPMQAG